MIEQISKDHEKINNPVEGGDRDYPMVIITSLCGRTYIGGVINVDENSISLFKPLVLSEFVGPDGRGNIGFNKPFMVADLPYLLKIKYDCIFYLNGKQPSDQQAVSGYQKAYEGLSINQIGLVTPDQFK